MNRGVKKIDDLGRIVIPSEIRKALGVKPGDGATFEIKNNKIVLTFDNVISNENKINKALELLEQENVDLNEIYSVLKGE